MLSWGCWTGSRSVPRGDRVGAPGGRSAEIVCAGAGCGRWKRSGGRHSAHVRGEWATRRAPASRWASPPRSRPVVEAARAPTTHSEPRHAERAWTAWGAPCAQESLRGVARAPGRIVATRTAPDAAIGRARAVGEGRAEEHRGARDRAARARGARRQDRHARRGPWARGPRSRGPGARRPGRSGSGRGPRTARSSCRETRAIVWRPGSARAASLASSAGTEARAAAHPFASTRGAARRARTRPILRARAGPGAGDRAAGPARFRCSARYVRRAVAPR